MISMEYEIIIILLKKMNNEMAFVNEMGLNVSNDAAQKIYLENKIFINQLQENCTNFSMNQAVDIFEEKMPYYMKGKITKDTIESMNRLSELRNLKNNEKLNQILSFGGLLFATLFGLPVINETLQILRNSFTFIPDIPIVKLSFVAVIVWSIIIIVLLRFSLKIRKHD